MRLRTATLRIDAPHNKEIGLQILMALPRGAIGYDHAQWPTIRVIYLDDEDVR